VQNVAWHYEGVISLLAVSTRLDVIESIALIFSPSLPSSSHQTRNIMLNISLVQYVRRSSVPTIHIMNMTAMYIAIIIIPLDLLPNARVAIVRY
jgi:hypothetical protein